MIDWWPWWITTTVALPIAALAVALALLAKRRDLRVVLALVGVVAVGLAVASPFVMGEDEGTPAMTVERLTAQEFARRADANCRSVDSRVAALGPYPTKLPAIARWLDAVIPVARAGLRAQARLRPPESEEMQARQWMQAMARIPDAFQAVRAGARSSDTAAITRANRRIGAAAADSKRLSKQLGMTYCFQG